MADQKISQLTDGTSFQAGDEAVVNRSGTNFKVDPTQFGSSIDVTGTVTADGLTVDGTAEVSGLNAQLYLVETDTTDVNTCLRSNASAFRLQTASDDKSAFTTRLIVDHSTGDVSLFEDTGTTAKFFWDASAESLGIGTTSPAFGIELRTTSFGDLASFRNIDGGDNHGLTIKDGAGTVDISAVYSTGAPDLTFTVGNNERVRIDSSGNVGIGTDSPASPNAFTTALEVAGSSASLVLTDNSGTGASSFEVASSSGSFRIYDETDERLRIDSSGNVGIGTNLPNNRLDVGDAGDAGINMSATADGILRLNGATYSFAIANNDTGTFLYNNGSSRAMVFGLNETERMRITSGGNVGIGTTSPTTGLEIVNSPAASVRISGGAVVAEMQPNETGGAAFYGTRSNHPIVFRTNLQERARIDTSGNLLVGGTGTPTSSAGNLVLFNGTAPTGNATDGVILYAEDVSTSSELKVRDEAGNVTTLSPHNFDLIPEGPSEDMAWSYYSERDGKRINVDMLKAIRLLEQLSGEKLVHIV